jgi:alpha-amylase
MFSDDIARLVEEMGYKTVLAEGVDSILAWRTPNYLYQPAVCRELQVLFRNIRLSEDITLHFSDPQWSGSRLSASSYADRIHRVGSMGEVVNIFVNLEAFGEYHGADSGILDLLTELPGSLAALPDTRFITPSQAPMVLKTHAKVNVTNCISWGDSERDNSLWIGNPMQQESVEMLYNLEKPLMELGEAALIRTWRRLQSCDHLAYMSTKPGSIWNSRRFPCPYESPYFAYIVFANMLNDLYARLG